MRERVLAFLTDAPATCEELTARFAALDGAVLLNTVRARVSDLHALGRVRPSGGYGKGESGKVRSVRWRIATPDELSRFAAAKGATAAAPGARP